ncbi:MAG: hydantoinase/oxoprolinase family protein [Thalassobaculum sp.]
MSGPAAGVIGGGPYRLRSPAIRTSITCDMGGTSFDVSLVADGGKRARGPDLDRFRPGRAHADDRDHHHRRRRRLHRPGRCRRTAAGRAGKRGFGSGARSATASATPGRP